MQEFEEARRQRALISTNVADGGRNKHLRDGRTEAPVKGGRLAGRIPFYPDEGESAETGGVDVVRLIRKYGLVGVLLMVLGAGAGVVSVVVSEPVFQVRIMLELQGINENWLKNSFETAASYDSNQINIATQIKILLNGPFLRRVSDRLQAETVPPPPPRTDVFSRVRGRLHKENQDPMQVMRRGLDTAFHSFDARPVNGTRLIELSCDSTNPQMAAQFINTMAEEFVDETMRSRAQ